MQLTGVINNSFSVQICDTRIGTVEEVNGSLANGNGNKSRSTPILEMK